MIADSFNCDAGNILPVDGQALQNADHVTRDWLIMPAVVDDVLDVAGDYTHAPSRGGVIATNQR